MTECDNAEMRDLLPDLVHDALSAEARDRVQEHLASCDACRDELQLLRAVHAARPVAQRIDVARIVSVLPRDFRTSVTVPTVPDDARVLTVSRSLAEPAPRKRPVFSGVWRMAATLAVAALGSWSVLSYQRAQDRREIDAGGASPVATAAERQNDSRSAGTPKVLETVDGQVATVDTPRAGSTTRSGAGAASRETALTLGDLGDYSDDDLQRMLDRLEKWDGTTAAEPVPTLPILPVTERGTR